MATTWQEFEKEAPQLAQAVRARFTAHRHHVLATLRKDGSPRVSGTEVQFREGDLTVGSMRQAVKALDLRRDPRFALHAHPGDESMEGGDAKLAGRAVEIVGEREVEELRTEEQPPGPFHAFRLELAEVVLTSVVTSGGDGGHLLIQRWRPGRPVDEIRRS